MGLIAKVATVVLAISFMTFVAFFGRLPALRRTPIAWMYRALWVYMPNGVLALDQALTGGRIIASAGAFGHSVWYGRHPTVLIFYILLLSVGEILYLPGAWPRLNGFHQVAGAIVIILPYVFLYLAAYSDPGVITAATHTHYMSLYPYDFTLFHPGQECRTCRILKPPRSKHCAVCKRCVARLDHHCVFINNCVGYGNQHWFLLLLLSTAVLTTYGGVLGLRMISENAQTRSSLFSLWKHHQQSWHHYFILLSYGIQRDAGVGSVTLLVIMTSPLVWGLLAYHIYLIYCGTTTNESMKWQDWQAEMTDGFAFRRRLPVQRNRHPRFEATWTRWPVEPAQILVRTEDGEPPNDMAPPGEGPWERVWHLRDMENIYDIGFWDNLVDIFVPNHSFRAEPQGDLERGKRPKHKKTKA
ncbi:DHHC zinc finger protein [Xylaria bambusicola]|uniref:DHHC zinc finger protein n=1 Tax=Xylaria bambusicola TaxID=326684 RepID=UPI002007F52E|nr:DHHC zinc finger protein [Xylaria bambusicola]KAI0518064.1 DHHC zinc finger protein [Xylaria bambusicola]